MYTDYYHFRAKPFQLTPDPRFFFGSSIHKKALAYLRYGLNQSEGFIVITGGIGTGKSLLVRSLFQEIDTSRLVAAQLASTQVNADDLLRLVVAAFDLPHADLSKASLLKRFEGFLKDCARAGKRVLLVVDEAQNLPLSSLEELRMLSNFEIDGNPLLQSFLLGQEGFRATLQAPAMEQLRQRIIASYHLQALNPQETRDYIEHRLRVVGWEGNPSFEDAAYRAVHEYTQGIPRRVNIFCDRLLLYGCLEELQTFPEAVVAAVEAEFALENRPTEPAAAPVAPTGTYSDQRITQLEKAFAMLVENAHWRAGHLERLQERIQALETAARLLRPDLDGQSGGETPETVTAFARPS